MYIMKEDAIIFHNFIYSYNLERLLVVTLTIIYNYVQCTCKTIIVSEIAMFKACVGHGSICVTYV